MINQESTLAALLLFLAAICSPTWSEAGPLSYHYPKSDCLVCDAPSIPPIGVDALNQSGGDAYKAVDALTPAAASGDLGAQISITFIMQDRLNGHLSGNSTEPFTWRETWAWWKIAAHGSNYMATLLGGAYFKGSHGLTKNERLSACLEMGDTTRTAHDRVRDCFLKYDSHGDVWK
jgi:hypothetical protein